MKMRLNVKCKYSVDIEFDNVPDDIAKKLIEMDEVEENSDVYDWLSDHIKEGDAYEWEFDIWEADCMDQKEEGEDVQR